MSFEWLNLTALTMTFVAAASLVTGAYLLARRPTGGQRLDTIIGNDPGVGDGPTGDDDSWTETVVKVARPLARLTQPADGWESSALRRRFIHAGWRQPSAPVLFFAFKTLLAFGLPALFLLAKLQLDWQVKPTNAMLAAGWLMACGYLLPNWLLNRRIGGRQREIFEAFPDALDLLTICVEAGLGLDAALARVSREIRLESPELADELELVTLEMRAGSGKERALRNLSLRTGVEDIESLVALLVQSERFGTSIGDSLRIQSDTLRVKRQQRAEELAAKISVKLVFPLVLCILPSIFIVVGGPAVIQIGKTFGKVFGGQ